MEPNFRLDWQQLVKEAIKRRKQSGYTQKETSLMVGVSRATVNAFERGKTNITLETALSLLHLVGLAPETDSVAQRVLQVPEEDETDP